MTPAFRDIMTLIGVVLDFIGVVIVALGSLVAVARFVPRWPWQRRVATATSQREGT